MCRRLPNDGRDTRRRYEQLRRVDRWCPFSNVRAPFRALKRLETKFKVVFSSTTVSALKEHNNLLSLCGTNEDLCSDKGPISAG
ncbi:hypothetical protein L596_004551 [Steinernema carpocapsae]|uniref:Uncharacterized protein n=1 Tax=Steinernema carpocapsae TaxID=34508 RepID=A0A4U8UX75_STECR|nr:hypothetical protein L596_004551 [Steinernema carpocapsae]